MIKRDYYDFLYGFYRIDIPRSYAGHIVFITSRSVYVTTLIGSDKRSIRFINTGKDLIAIGSADRNAFIFNLDVVSFNEFYLVSGYDKTFMYSHK